VQNETDVLAFRGMDGAHAAVVRGVDIAHLEAGALRSEATASECGERAQVLYFVERIVLLHELRELVGREKFSDSGLERARVDERYRRRCLRVHHGHAVLDVALHAREADTHTLFEQFARKTHTAEAEVIDVVRLGDRAHVTFGDVRDNANHVVERKSGVGKIAFLHAQSETAVEMEAADAREIIALGGEYGLDVIAGSFRGRNISITKSAINFHERLLLRMSMVMTKRQSDRIARRGRFLETTQDLFVSRKTKYAQQRSHRKAPLSVDFDVHTAVGITLDLYPNTARGDDFCSEIALAFVGHAFKKHSVGARKLRNDDAFDAIDDERSVRRHPRKICEEYFLLLFITSRFVLEAHYHRKRRFICLHRSLGVVFVPAKIAEREFYELQFKFLSRVVRDRREFFEHALRATLHEIREGFYLRFDEARQFHQRLAELPEILLRTHTFCFYHVTMRYPKTPRSV
jgi:hypothetical protein